MRADAAQHYPYLLLPDAVHDRIRIHNLCR